MQQVLADNLYLAQAATEVTQAIALVGDNALKVHVVVASYSGPLSNNLTVTVEGSTDLENWEALACYVAYVSYAPSTSYVPAYSGGDVISFPYVRVKFEEGDDADLLVRASISTWSM